MGRMVGAADGADHKHLLRNQYINLSGALFNTLRPTATLSSIEAVGALSLDEGRPYCTCNRHGTDDWPPNQIGWNSCVKEDHETVPVGSNIAAFRANCGGEKHGDEEQEWNGDRQCHEHDVGHPPKRPVKLVCRPPGSSTDRRHSQPDHHQTATERQVWDKRIPWVVVREPGNDVPPCTNAEQDCRDDRRCVLEEWRQQ
jgi:hypothetical protein